MIWFFIIRVVAYIYTLGGLLLGGYSCGVSWYWASLYFYYDGDHWIFIDASDVIGFHRPDIEISGKFGIIWVDISIFSHDLLIISMFDRIETYC